MEDTIKWPISRLGKQLLALGLVSILSVLLVLLCWGRLNVERCLSQMDYFRIKDVRLITSWPLTPDQVRQWLPELKGTSLLLLQPGKLLSHLETKPWVAGITFKKEYPDRFQIVVESRVARAILLEKDRAYYLDTKGQKIDIVSGAYSAALDLPIISFLKSQSAPWILSKVVSVLSDISEIWKNEYPISQVALDDYPYLRVYLSSPQVEVLLDFEHWENELAQVPTLLHFKLPQLKQVRKINLVFPKKAIVSASLSK